MNISSAIIMMRPDHANRITESVENMKGIQVHFSKHDRIVITIEAEALEDEVGLIHQVEAVPGVISVSMVFSYSESELAGLRDKLEFRDDIPSWLNDENVTTRDIRYSGDLKKRL